MFFCRSIMSTPQFFNIYLQMTLYDCYYLLQYKVDFFKPESSITLFAYPNGLTQL